jgi:hypothetical protein
MKMVATWVKKFTEESFGGSPFEVGQTVLHPDGRNVRIISGQYWGEHGLSNHWAWREVLPDGTLSATHETGYGWRPTQRLESVPITAGDLADYFATLPRDLPVYRQNDRGEIALAQIPFVLKVETIHPIPLGRYPSFTVIAIPRSITTPNAAKFDAVIL